MLTLLANAAPIVDPNAKTFDLLMIVALILFVIVFAWQLTLKSFINALWLAAFVFTAAAFLFLS